MNESYTSFAQVYDMFMDNVDYPAWSKYLIQLLKEYQVEDGLVLDLGCGTGNMTELLAKEGYDMIAWTILRICSRLPVKNAPSPA